MAQRYRTLADYFAQTGRTQGSLAKRIGVTAPYISLIASGARQPSLRMALRIAEATGVPLASLLRDSEVSA